MPGPPSPSLYHGRHADQAAVPKSSPIIMQDSQQQQQPHTAAALNRQLSGTAEDTGKNEAIGLDCGSSTTESTSKPADSDAPDGGYGWVCAVCVFSQNVATWGFATTFGVFLSFFLDRDYFPGATRLHYAFIGGLQVGMALLTSPGANYVSRRFGFRTSMVAGTFGVALGQIFAGLSNQIWHLFLAQGVLFGSSMGFVFVPALPILGQWFTRRRAVAFGFATGGSGLGGLVFSITTRIAIENISIRWAYIINGLASFVILLPSVLLMRPRVVSIESSWQAFQPSWLIHPGYIWVYLWAFLSMLGYIIGLFTLPTYATQALQLSQSQGAALQAVLSAAQMLGRPTVGLTLDWAGRINMAGLATLIAGLAVLLIWNFADSFAVLIVFSIFEGFTFGTIWAASGPVSAEVVGVDNLGSALAPYWVALTLPAVFAEPIALELLTYSQETLGWDGQHSFRIMINFAGGSFILAAICLYGAKVYVQKSWKLLVKT